MGSLTLPFVQQVDSTTTVFGIIENSGGGTAISGNSNVGGTGVFASSANGIGVDAQGGTVGVRAFSFTDVGLATAGAPSILAEGDVVIIGNLEVIDGNIAVGGTGSKLFKIDHPLDPADRYLNHFCVESAEVKNMYDGIVVLDAKGEATIDLPAWFEALNTDFRYQLTPIGKHAALYIAREVRKNKFTIAGGEAGMKVSWQVTGVSHDASGKTHHVPVEEQKSEKERGYYLNPKAHGAPEEKGISWALHPRQMRETKERLKSTKAKQEKSKK